MSILKIAADGPVPLTVSGVPGRERWTGGGLSSPLQCTTVTYLPPSSSLAIEVGGELGVFACCAAVVFAWAVSAAGREAAMAGMMVAAAIVAVAAAASVAATPVTRFIVFPPLEMSLRDDKVRSMEPLRHDYRD